MLGWPAGAPYDRVLVSAEPAELPAELVAQLADDGVMVIPVAGEMLRVTNPGAGDHPSRALPVRAAALTSAPALTSLRTEAGDHPVSVVAQAR